MADNEFLGSTLYASWVTATGTTTLNTEFRNFTYTPSIDFVDATAGADAARRRINSFKDGQIRYTALMQNDMGTTLPGQLLEGMIGTMTWGEAGSAVGKAKSSAAFICQGMTRTAVYNDIVQLEVSWQQNGARTDGTF